MWLAIRQYGAHYYLWEYNLPICILVDIGVPIMGEYEGVERGSLTSFDHYGYYTPKYRFCQVKNALFRNFFIKP